MARTFYPYVSFQYIVINEYMFYMELLVVNSILTNVSTNKHTNRFKTRNYKVKLQR
jgi:hypothetical protein